MIMSYGYEWRWSEVDLRPRSSRLIVDGILAGGDSTSHMTWMTDRRIRYVMS